MAGEYDNFTAEEAAAMRRGLQECGLIHAIVTWNGQIVDGRHREQFCRELEVERRYDDISNKTEDQMRHYVAGLNQHRRARTTPMTNEEKRARVEAELMADPDRSDNAIAKVVGVHNETVAAARRKVTESVTPSSERKSATGKVGEGQRRRHAEKRARAEAALRADPNRSNRTIADDAQVSADLITAVRLDIFGKNTPDFISQRRVGNRRGVTVPSGKKLSELYRDGMALEAAGEIAKDLTKKLGVGLLGYLRGRDILRLADNPRLTTEDADRVRDAVAFLDEKKLPGPAYEQIKYVADRLLYSTRKGPPIINLDAEICAPLYRVHDLVQMFGHLLPEPSAALASVRAELKRREAARESRKAA